MTPIAAAVNPTALVAFGIFVAATVAITYQAARKTVTATDFWAAGRSISGAQNGLAIAGDLMSAATFLGFTGLIFLAGFDGWILATAAITAFLLVLLLFAERMRNAGKYTIADVLAFRLRDKPVRAAAATATLSIAIFYLIAQLVGAGVILQALSGLDFSVSVILTGVVMIGYVTFGGMLATTWVQIVKAVLILVAGTVLTLWVLAKFNFNPIELFNSAAEQHPAGADYLGPGVSDRSAPNTISVALAFVIGTAALPHILIRFFTVPDAQAARSSVGWAVAAIGALFVMTSVIGFGARAILGPNGERAAGAGGNLAAPNLAQALGGGPGTFGGDVMLAFIGAAAFATILAVVAGLVISAAGAVAHDLWSGILRSGQAAEAQEPVVARVAAIAIGAVAIALTLSAGPNFNIAFLVGLALSVAASANFPTLLLALTWPRFNTAGALTGITFGLVSSVALIVGSPAVWPGADPPFGLDYPTLISIPAGFFGCWLGTVLGARESSSFTELHVRAQTGIGAETGHDNFT